LMQFLQIVSDIGVAQTMIKFRRATRDEVDTLFTLSVLRGLILALIMVLSAPLAATLYGDPRIAGVFCGLALVPLLNGWINPRFYEFERELDFSREVWVASLTKVAAIAVAIGIALTFRSYWAIVLGLVAGAMTEAVLSYVVRPARPRFTLAAFSRLIGFTGWLTGVAVLVGLNNRQDLILMGAFTSKADTGAYYVGDQLALLTTEELASPIAKALYPGLTSLETDPVRMKAAFLGGVAAIGALAVPAGVGFGAIADRAVPILLGDQWAQAILVVQAFAPSLGLMAIFSSVQHYAMAQGRTALIFWRKLIFFLIRTPFFVWAVMAHGIVGAVIAALAGFVLHAGLNLALFARLSGGRFWEPVTTVWRSLIAAGAMAVWLLLFAPGVSLGPVLPPIAGLMLDVASGALIYGLVHIGLWRLVGRPAGVETAIFAQARHMLAR
ncbi:MAG: oligosaccharide flippase family protein, partial [Pseudomonadota bacterium]